MAGPGRPTLRCLRVDLVELEGWEDSAQRRLVQDGGLPPPSVPLSEIAHPLVRHVATTFDKSVDDESRHENIAGLNDPMFWKAKTGRWRGAVHEPTTPGEASRQQAWLCAAGLRASGDRRDFYAEFTGSVQAQGADTYLPTDDDRARLRLEQAHRKLVAWKTEVAESVFEAIAACVGDTAGSTSVAIPTVAAGQSPLAALEVEVVQEVAEHRQREGEALLEVAVRITDWSEQVSREILIPTICAAISRSEDDWDATPIGETTRYAATVPQAVIDEIVVAVAVDDHRVGRPDAGEPAAFEPTSKAHYDPQREIARGVVEGKAVVGLCGRCFVPRQDPQVLPVCDVCEATYHRILAD